MKSMELSHFDRSYARNGKIRWLCRFLGLSRLLDLKELRMVIDEKLERISRRLGEEVQPSDIDQIVENYILAKANKRLSDLKIKPYKVKTKRNSPTRRLRSKARLTDPFAYEMSNFPIYKEKQYRPKTNPSILVPGFVPDGNEAFFLLRKIFLKLGSVYYVNYPTERFSREALFHQMYDMVRDINGRKFKKLGKRGAPFLVGTSFGCSMILSFLRWAVENGYSEDLKIKGLVLISPVLCLEDVVDLEMTRQKTLVGRAISQLVDVDPDNPQAVEKAMQKARNIFVKMFTSGRDRLNFSAKDLIPVFAIEDEVLNIFNLDVGANSGFFHRYLELKQQKPIEVEFLSDIPTLVLFAEGEQDVLTAKSPTLETLSDINKLQAIFPNGTVEYVYSQGSERKVTHSDLIFQAKRFQEHLVPWLQRMRS
jgi:hypothetical protein